MAKDYTFPEEMPHMQIKHKSALEISCFTLLAEQLLPCISNGFSLCCLKGDIFSLIFSSRIQDAPN